MVALEEVVDRLVEAQWAERDAVGYIQNNYLRLKQEALAGKTPQQLAEDIIMEKVLCVTNM